MYIQGESCINSDDTGAVDFSVEWEAEIRTDGDSEWHVMNVKFKQGDSWDEFDACELPLFVMYSVSHACKRYIEDNKI